MQKENTIYYGKEPFDLRLTILRMFRNLHIILGITLLGTLLFGGGYYIKNVVLYKDTVYETTSTYKISFSDTPTEPGDYYINEMTWNTYVQSGKFLNTVWAYLQENGAYGLMDEVESAENLAAYVTAKLDSDIYIPSTVVTTSSEQWTLELAGAVERTMVTAFVEENEQLTHVEIIDPARNAQRVMPDVRPLRAFILSGILSCFFTVIVFLLKELTTGGIWLPAALHRRYGIPVVGTVNSKEAASNLQFLFSEKSKIAVCPADEHIDPVEVIGALKQILSCEATGGEEIDVAAEFHAMPAPLLCTGSVRELAQADGVLLVARAGKYAGKPLEYILEYLSTQKIEVTAVLLWEADEWLINTYYMGESVK